MSHVVRAVAGAPMSMPGLARGRVRWPAPPADHGARERLFLQRIRVDGMRGITGGPERDAQRGGEVVVIDPLDHAVDHLLGIFEVGVEQRDRQRAVLRHAYQVGVTHLWPKEPGDLADRARIGRYGHPVPLTPRFKHDEREKVLGPDRLLQLAVEDEVEGVRRQQPRALLEELIAHWRVTATTPYPGRSP